MVSLKCKIAFLLVMSMVFFSGCFDDKAYHSKYRVSLKKDAGEDSLCSDFRELDDIFKFIDCTIKDNEFKNLRAINENPEMKIYEIEDVSRSYGEFMLIEKQGAVLIKIFTWNPGPYEDEEIKKTKIYENGLIEKLKQKECFEVKKINP